MEVSCCCIIYNHLYNFHHWFNTENSIHCFLFSFLFSFSCKLSWLVLHSTMTGMRFMMVFGGALLCNSLILNLHLFSFDSFIMTNEISSQDQSLNVHSPYYLHSGENLAITLVSPVLDPINYNSWSHSMLTTLSTKNKVEFMDGSIQKCASCSTCSGNIFFWYLCLLLSLVFYY